MKQTAMQELKSDLVLTKETTKNSFSEIKNQEIKDACIKVVEMTLNSIITRIDTELLAMEKEQSLKMPHYDLDALADEYANDMGCDDGTTEFDFKAGFQKALELLTFKSE